MSSTRLNSFQLEVLNLFFRKERRFFLTGGGALAGYYLGHRATKDLDLFTSDGCLEQGAVSLLETARELDATAQCLQTSPDFRRFLLCRGTESVVVDLVDDFAPQIFTEKRVIGEIRIDHPEEILANKLRALREPNTLTHLVDVRALEGAGYSIADALRGATRKDWRLTPALLAWLLSLLEIGDGAETPGGVSPAELRAYLKDLVVRLTRWARPHEAPAAPSSRLA